MRLTLSDHYLTAFKPYNIASCGQVPSIIITAIFSLMYARGEGCLFRIVNLPDEVCGSSCANRDIDVETASYLKFHKTNRSYQRKIETKHETVLIVF